MKRYIGTVEEAYSDLTLKVACDQLGGEMLDDVHPEAVGPVRWRPRPGDKVVLYKRGNTLRPDTEVTWVGWLSAPEDEHLVPTFIDAGEVHITSEDGDVTIALEDVPEGQKAIDDRTKNDDDLPKDKHAALRLGRHDASESLVLGQVYKSWMEDHITEHKTMIDAHDTFDTAENTLMTGLTTFVTACITLEALVNTLAVNLGIAGVPWDAGAPNLANPGAVATAAGALAAGTGAFTAAATTFTTQIATYQADIATHQTALNTAGTAFDSTLRNKIPDHLSDFVFTAKEPGEDQP